MSLTLSQLLPGIETGLNRIGFLFGAGTSKEAGYPLMGDLTKTVVSNLHPALKTTLDEILAAKGLTYDPAAGTPNIEILSDLVTEYFVTTQEPKYGDLESEIRKLIVDAILSVTAPDLTHHVRFLEALKRSLTVISQRPREVSATILSQCNSFLCLRLSNPDDQSYVRNLLPDSVRGITSMFSTLRRGEGILLGDSVMMPTRIRIDPPNPTPQSEDTSFYAMWNEEPEEVDVASVLDAWRRQAVPDA